MLALLAAVPPVAVGQVTYTDASTADKLDSKLDLRLGTADLGLSADMRLIGQQGTTKVLPRITSLWAPLQLFDVRTVLDYGDLNSATARPKVDTSIVVRSDVPLVERIEASLQRTERSAQQSLGLKLSPFETGLDLRGGAPLAFRADMTVKRIGERSLASSKLTSSWGLGEALTMQSVLQLDGQQGSSWERSALDTKLVYRSPFSFIDRFEGEIYDAPHRHRHSLAVLLPKWSRGEQHGSSFTVTGKALIREMVEIGGNETRSVGFETKLVGVLPPLLGGRNALSLNVERGLGLDDDLHRSSLAYDHAWSPGGASIGLNLKMLRGTDTLEPAMDFTWSAMF